MSSTLKSPPIVNTSPLLYLHQIGQLDILPKLYGTVITPTAVEQELALGKAKGIKVPNLNHLNWLKICAVESASTIPNVIDLGRGEAEVIALGLKNVDRLLILDDQLGRRVATLYNLRSTGTLGVLIKAKQSGYLSEIAPVIAQLKAQGMWLTQPIIQQALKLAKEIK
jgi:predicted nucleic acid-binding protein